VGALGSPEQIGHTWPSLAGFSLGTASAVLAVGTTVYARAVGGFPFYDPSLMRIYRWVFSCLLPDWSSERWGFGGLARFAGTLLPLLSEPCCSGLEQRLESRSKDALPTASVVGGHVSPRWELHSNFGCCGVTLRAK